MQKAGDLIEVHFNCKNQIRQDLQEYAGCIFYSSLEENGYSNSPALGLRASHCFAIHSNLPLDDPENPVNPVEIPNKYFESIPSRGDLYEL